MKVIKLFAILAMMLAPLSVLAVCPTQETTVVFMNGIWTPDWKAFEHKEALAEDVYARDISPDCVHFALSHTQDDDYITDVVESVIQKSQERNIPLSPLVDMLFRSISPDNIFLNMIAEVYLRQVGGVVDTQLDLHVKKFHELALDKGHLGIAVTHSQGGLYGNALFGRLTPTEQTNTRLVTVATPAQNVAGGGQNTRLSRDGVANLFFANALSAGTIPNTGLCDHEVNEDANSWLCHGFETGYLHDVGARTQIVSDIVALLPTTPSVQFLSLTAGNPKIPGDGILITSDGGQLGLGDYIFELQPHFSLQGITNGMTVSVFPPSSVPLQNLSTKMIFAVKNKPVECDAEAGGDIPIPLSVNGVAGIATNVPQGTLNLLVSLIREVPICGNVSLADLFVAGVYIFDTAATGPFIRQLDAVAIGIGENAFPTAATPVM